MPKYQKLTQNEWDLLQRRYEHGESPRALAVEFGIAESTLYRRRSLEEWSKSGPPGSVRAGIARDLEIVEGTIERVAGSADLPATVACQNDLQTSEAQCETTTNLDHIQTARHLRRRINELLKGEFMGASVDRQPQAVKDLAMALERLQKIERTALGLDQADSVQRPGVVILIPGKLSPEEWERQSARRIDVDCAAVNDA